MMRQIADSAYICGDPGMQYDTTVNRWHTSKNTAPINASNPCSEYMFLDDSACNLASLNLMKFADSDGRFDIEVVPQGRRHHDHRAGNHRRVCQLSHAKDRNQFLRLTGRSVWAMPISARC